MEIKLSPNDLVRSMGTVASLPNVLNRLQTVMKTPSCSVRDIGNVISEDPDLTARLLRLVNSSFYSLSQEISTVSRAVVVIGTRELRDLTLATSVVSVFDKIPEDLVNMEMFWRHSLACGLFARELAKLRRIPDPERFFVTGMLHDIGKLVMYLKIPKQAREVLERCREVNEPFFRVENDVLGFNHTQVGLALIKAWNLPENIRTAVRFHHDHWIATQEVATVHIGDILANSLQMGSSGERMVPPLMTPAWKFLGLSEDALGPLVRNVKRQFKNTTETILGLEKH